MPKITSKFVCQECGSITNKWSGQCSSCNAWSSIIEEPTQSTFTKTNTASGKKLEFMDLIGDAKDVDRIDTNIAELNRVLGSGLVPASAILIGGDPGIGKSTLVLQTIAMLEKNNQSALYVSGEESVDQVRLRAKRLKIEKSNIKLVSATNVTDIIASLNIANPPKILVIDSIQTMFIESITSAPGTVSQVRSSAHELISFTKRKNITLIIVGHVTKEGQIAGPKVLEHMVDTVLYFEGERGHQFRILRTVKNRFGPANEIGVFEMVEYGLKQVPNPSSLFLSQRDENTSGSVVYAGIEGTRPVLVEIQALVAPTFMATPRRAVVGWDSNRLAMIIAVLHTRYGVFLGDKEVYLNIAGGLKINEPAADLAVAVALLSAVTNKALDKETIVFGEIGLSGELRMVSQNQTRLKEADKLGFKKAITPKGFSFGNKGFILNQLGHIKELTRYFSK